VIMFNAHDYGPNNFYGITRIGNSAGPNYSHKPSYTALNEAAHQVACTVCGTSY
jgi:hypothetical protein